MTVVNVATGREADYGDEALFGDVDPVPAVRELATTGKLSSTPVTQLVDDGGASIDPA